MASSLIIRGQSLSVHLLTWKLQDLAAGNCYFSQVSNTAFVQLAWLCRHIPVRS